MGHIQKLSVIWDSQAFLPFKKENLKLFFFPLEWQIYTMEFQYTNVSSPAGTIGF